MTYLYRFIKNRAFYDEVITEHKLHISDVSYFNDPNEFMTSVVQHHSSLGSLREALSGGMEIDEVSFTVDGQPVDFIDQNELCQQWNQEHKLHERKYNRVVCFTKAWDNPFMWKEYADDSRGVAFEFCDLFTGVADTPSFHHGAVSYEPIQIDLLGKDLGDYQKLTDALFVKEKKFQEEDEYRCIVYVNELTKTYYLEFQPEKLSAVYLGYNMPAGEKKRVLELVERNNPQAKVYDVKRNKTNFTRSIVSGNQ